MKVRISAAGLSAGAASINPSDGPSRADRAVVWPARPSGDRHSRCETNAELGACPLSQPGDGAQRSSDANGGVQLRRASAPFGGAASTHPAAQIKLQRRTNAGASAVAKRIADAVNTAAMTARMLAQQQLNNQDMASPADARSMDGRLFQAWSADIDAEAKKYPQIQLATPQAWLGIFYYLKGTRADDLANPEIRKKKYGNFLESGVSSVAPRSEPEKKDELTDAEKHVADKMKVS